MPFPNFIVIGAYKSGTTSLYHYLKEHPEIFMSHMKETNYFAYNGKYKSQTIWNTELNPNDFRIRSIEAYRNLYKDVFKEKAIGDVSPMYLISSIAPINIKKFIPNGILIAILRNPVDKAYSVYLMRVRNRRETRSFKEVVENPLEEQIVRSGFYHLQLKRYFDLFDSAQINIYIFEDFKANTENVTQDIYKLLKVDTAFVPDINIKYNIGGLPKRPKIYSLIGGRRYMNLQRIFPIVSRLFTEPVRKMRVEIAKRYLVESPRLPVEIRKQLIDVYEDDILKLQDLLKRDLTNWLEIETESTYT